MTTEQKIENLKKNCPTDFLENFRQAIMLARNEYKDRIRTSGDQYFNHSIDVAYEVANRNFDYITSILGLLHHIDLNEKNTTFISKNISNEIVDLLELYKKLDLVIKSTDASYTLTTRFALASAKDLRPVIVHILNALCDSRILQSIEHDETRKGIVKRSLNIHSKIAEYLGFENTRRDILEECFRITQKDDFEYISRIYGKKSIDEETLKKYKDYIHNLVKEYEDNIVLEARIKSKYSTNEKLNKLIKEGSKNPIDRIQDLIGFRIIAENKETCFKILNNILDKGEVLIDSFDDYISRPKPNGYRAMQGPVIFPEISNLPIEIHILTKGMHHNNMYGEASHIVYKESKTRYAKPSSKYRWIEETQKEIQKNKENSKSDFSIPINVSIFPEEIYALTPMRRIIELEKGDTVTDFAYLVHTDIGNSMVAAKVNGKSVKFDHPLETGDVVEIITQKGKKHPKAILLHCANSESTKTKISRAIK